jgi:hypothetical protein
MLKRLTLKILGLQLAEDEVHQNLQICLYQRVLSHQEIIHLFSLVQIFFSLKVHAISGVLQ